MSEDAKFNSFHESDAEKGTESAAVGGAAEEVETERGAAPVSGGAAGAAHAHRYHMPDVKEIGKLIKKYHITEFFKSNAVLLSRFTSAYPALLVAVNLGGLGTPIASLASLITLNTYRKLMPGETKKYLLKFLLINFTFLALLIGIGYLNPLVIG